MKVVKILLAIPIAFIFFCLCLYGYCELKKAYWDREVRLLCEKDGGVKVFEKVELSADEYPDLIDERGVLMIRFKNHAKNDDPYFRKSNTEILRNGSPQIFRVEQSIVRRRDNKKVSSQVEYIRRGGDFPISIAHESSFSCGNSSEDIARLKTVITRKGV